MIIKVPVYVEIENVDPELLQEVVHSLSNSFYKVLRKEDFEKKSTHFLTIPKEIRSEFFVKILSKDKAFEALRTKK